MKTMKLIMNGRAEDLQNKDFVIPSYLDSVEDMATAIESLTDDNQ